MKGIVPDSPSCPPPAPTAPSYLLEGRYLGVDFIGRGELADVFSGTDTWSGELVAVHRLRVDRGGQRAAFRRRAERLFGLTSARVVRAIATGDDRDGNPYLITELLIGRAVDKLVRVRWEVACEITRLAALAVAEMHVNGLQHGALVARSFFVASSSDGGPRVKLLDLGVGDRTATAAKDRRALAAILHRMLLGTPPLPVKAGAPPPVVRLADAPDELGVWLGQWLAAPDDDPTASPTEIAAALRKLLDPEGERIDGDRESAPMPELLVFPKNYVKLT